MRSGNTADADDQAREGNHGRSDLPRTWPTASLCPQEQTAAEGKQASEELGKTLTVARKPVQEKSCTSSGLHLSVPPNCVTPR